MRFSFPGFGSRPSSPAGSTGVSLRWGEQKVSARVQGGQLQLWSPGAELLESLDLEGVTWQACVLPSKEHGLSLTVASPAAGKEGATGGGRELLLCAKSKERVDALAQQLGADALRREAQATAAAAAGAQRQQELPRQWPRHEVRCGSGSSQNEDWQEEQGSGPGPRSLSFGSPVADEPCEGVDGGCASTCGGEDGQWLMGAAALAASPTAGRHAGMPDQLSDASASDSDTSDSELEDGVGGSRRSQWRSSRQASSSRAGGAPLPALLTARSAPPSPILPGLPLADSPVSSGRPEQRRMPAASAPASPVSRRSQPGQPAPAAPAASAPGASGPEAAASGEEAGRAHAQPAQQVEPPEEPPAQAQPPLRLLSFSGRFAVGAGGAGSGCSVPSHVERLQAAVSFLSRELEQSRRPGSACGQGGSRAASPAKAPALEAAAAARNQGGALMAAPKQPGQAGTAGTVHGGCRHEPCGSSGSPPTAVAASLQQEQARPPAEPAAQHGDASSGSSGSCQGAHVEPLARENALLVQQQGALHAELGRMQGRLAAAAADNMWLAQQAAAAMRQLQAAAEEARGAQARERQLAASLAAAVARCEAVGRELAGLCGKLDARSAQCQELRGALEAASGEKAALTAALTAAQLRLREATPAGFAAESADLRRQAEAAQQEASAAKAAAAAAAGRAAEAQRHEAEVAGHMREAVRCLEAARSGRAAGLAREQQLAGEVRVLRRQLAGKLPDGDPSKTAQASLACICCAVLWRVGAAVERADQLAAANASLQQERAALLAQVQQLQSVGQELSTTCRALEAGMQSAVRERDELKAELARVKSALASAEQHAEQERQQLEASLSTASGRLASSEERAQGDRAQAAALQAQVESLRREAAEAAQRTAAREQELQPELRLAAVRAEAEAQAAISRAEALAAAQAAEASRQQERVRAQEAELAAARREAALLGAVQQRLQVELQRAKEERAVAARDLQLDATSAKAGAARLAQELRSAESAAGQQRQATEDARREAQQAQAQAAAAAEAVGRLSQERKELQARADRLEVERDRAARDRDAAAGSAAVLRQQLKLMQASVVSSRARVGGSASSGFSASKQLARRGSGGRRFVCVGGGSGSSREHVTHGCQPSRSSSE